MPGTSRYLEGEFGVPGESEAEEKLGNTKGLGGGEPQKMYRKQVGPGRATHIHTHTREGLFRKLRGLPCVPAFRLGYAQRHSTVLLTALSSPNAQAQDCHPRQPDLLADHHNLRYHR